MKQVSVHSQTLPPTSTRPLRLVPKVPTGCGARVTAACTRGLGFVAGDPGLRRIGGIDQRHGLRRARFSAAAKAPLLVGRQPIGDAGLARHPGRVSRGIVPADADDGYIRPRIAEMATLGQAPASTQRAILGDRDLALHDGELARQARSSRSGPSTGRPCAREIAGDPVAESEGVTSASIAARPLGGGAGATACSPGPARPARRRASPA